MANRGKTGQVDAVKRSRTPGVLLLSGRSGIAAFLSTLFTHSKSTYTEVFVSRSPEPRAPCLCSTGTVGKAIPFNTGMGGLI